MAIFDRFNITVVAGAGLCGAAMAFSAHATAAPLPTGGYACMQGQAGEAAPPLAGGPGAAGAAGAPVTACTTSASLSDMAGGPLAVPGPIPVVPVGAPPVPVAPPLPFGAPPVPVAPPLPFGAPPVPVGAPPMPVVPVGAPLIALAGAPVDGVAGAPIIDMAGTGKGAPTGPAPAGGPVSGQPVPPGPGH